MHFWVIPNELIVGMDSRNCAINVPKIVYLLYSMEIPILVCYVDSCINDPVIHVCMLCDVII